MNSTPHLRSDISGASCFSSSLKRGIYTLSSNVELNAGFWPDRVKPLLTIYDPDTNTHHVLASFRSEEAMRIFLQCVKRGMAYGGGA